MVYLHWQRQARLRSRIQIPNPVPTLYYAEHVHIAQTQIPTLYFCSGQEYESESKPESISGNINEPSRSNPYQLFVNRFPPNYFQTYFFANARGLFAALWFFTSFQPLGVFGKTNELQIPVKVCWFLDLLPPPNEVCEGNVFTGVCLSTGGFSVQGEGLCPRGVSVKGGSLSRGKVSVEGLSGGGGCLSRKSLSGRPPYGNVQEVCIPLECILVNLVNDPAGDHSALACMVTSLLMGL